MPPLDGAGVLLGAGAFTGGEAGAVSAGGVLLLTGSEGVGVLLDCGASTAVGTAAGAGARTVNVVLALSVL